jgi:hypothetical protein
MTKPRENNQGNMPEVTIVLFNEKARLQCNNKHHILYIHGSKQLFKKVEALFQPQERYETCFRHPSYLGFDTLDMFGFSVTSLAKIFRTHLETNGVLTPELFEFFYLAH